MHSKLFILAIIVCVGVNPVVGKAVQTAILTDVKDTIGIHCTSTGMHVTVDMTALHQIHPGSDYKSMVIGDDTGCYLNLAGNNAKADVCFTCCYMKEREDDDNIYFSNYINYAPGDRRNKTEIVVFEEWRVNLECSIPKHDTGSATIGPDTGGGFVNGTVLVAAEVVFYKDHLFTTPVGDAALGSTVYVDVRVNLADGMKMVTQSCIATPKVPHNNIHQDLITSRCTYNSMVTQMETTDKYNRFSMKVFHFTHIDGPIRVECKVKVCEDTDNQGECANCPHHHNPLVG